MSCHLETGANGRLIAGIAAHCEKSGNIEAIVAENLRLQGEVEALKQRAETSVWLGLENENAALREERAALHEATRALQKALDQATDAIGQISGTVAIWRAHQP